MKKLLLKLAKKFKIKELIEWLEEDTSTPNQGNGGTPPSPVDPNTIPESGEYIPDPVIVLYKFKFQDGKQLIFREHHTADVWGYYPHPGGGGQIIYPDGRIEGVYVNKLIRHGGFGSKVTPVTTLSHGKRLFWMSGSEGGGPNSKKVTIFEDGWGPHVESSVLKVQKDIGIDSPLMSVDVTVEKRKND